jgi:cellulose synthase/poly-beta-1,6-N-acetylglucosamine synthase-like glycosyltransferase
LVSALFAASLFGLGWTYAGYPLILGLLSRRRQAPRTGGNNQRVCVIISARNARRSIEDKIANTLALLWPDGLLRIIVVSDGSSDGTAQLARAAGGSKVHVIESTKHLGKDACLGLAVDETDADIVVFTDVTTRLERDALTRLIACFDQPDIGCVSGTDRASNPSAVTQAESLYVRYEMWLRSVEAATFSMVSASGCLFAVRRELCTPWLGDLTSDFAIPLYARTRGFRTLRAPDAMAHYPVSDHLGTEFHRKVRTVVHGLQVVSHFRACLNPFQYPLLALQLISHKVLRWLSPFLLVGMLVGSAMLVTAPVWMFAFCAQISVYVLAFAAWFSPRAQRRKPLRLLAYFALVNTAIVVAWSRFAIGHRHETWEPSHA